MQHWLINLSYDIDNAGNPFFFSKIYYYCKAWVVLYYILYTSTLDKILSLSIFNGRNTTKFHHIVCCGFSFSFSFLFTSNSLCVCVCVCVCVCDDNRSTNVLFRPTFVVIIISCVWCGVVWCVVVLCGVLSFSFCRTKISCVCQFHYFKWYFFR